MQVLMVYGVRQEFGIRHIIDIGHGMDLVCIFLHVFMFVEKPGPGHLYDYNVLFGGHI